MCTVRLASNEQMQTAKKGVLNNVLGSSVFEFNLAKVVTNFGFVITL